MDGDGGDGMTVWWTVLVVGFVIAAAASAALTALLTPVLRRAGVVDVPGHRSLHHCPTPRGAGVALVLGAVAATAMTLVLMAGSQGPVLLMARIETVTLCVLFILAMTLVGLAEDLFSLPPSARLCLQIGLGLLMGLGVTWVTGAHLWWSLMVAGCAAGLVNVTNFMDGANGLAAGHAVVTGSWFVLVSVAHPVPGLGLVLVTVAGAAAGFLPFNVPRARLFLGDCGSYALGAAWSFAATMSLASAVPASVSVAPLLVLVADTGFTLFMRVRAGQRWYEPHRLHVYQRLVALGWPHWAVAGLVSAVAAACSLLAWGALTMNVQALGWVAMASLLLAYLRLPLWLGGEDPFRPTPAGVSR
ncbi:glycosyl transferase family 4 [Actinomyces respiraculi]|uniref:glycosyl transferase family 4 n=1 Tax=Actinomyces respiraculi TaxID=2744574 RepID=UPI001F392133|nr:glycosyl transferase family 4 [Actinomyces respiraculi]